MNSHNKTSLEEMLCLNVCKANQSKKKLYMFLILFFIILFLIKLVFLQVSLHTIYLFNTCKNWFLVSSILNLNILKFWIKIAVKFKFDKYKKNCFQTLHNIYQIIMKGKESEHRKKCFKNLRKKANLKWMLKLFK